MTALWDEAMEAAVALMNQRAANWRRDAYTAPMRSLLDRADEAKAAAEAIRALPRPPEADRHAAIVATGLAWREARADFIRGKSTGTGAACITAERAFWAACDAELAARAEKGGKA